jgi:hypothetical protein
MIRHDLVTWMSSAYVVTLPATPLIFEAFIREAFSFQRHLASFWCNSVSLEAKGQQEESCVGLFYCLTTLRSMLFGHVRIYVWISWGTLRSSVWSSALIKKRKFSPSSRKFRGIGCKVIYDWPHPHIWWKYLCISSYIRKHFLKFDFAPDPSEFPCIWGKLFVFFFISVRRHKNIIYNKNKNVCYLIQILK